MYLNYIWDITLKVEPIHEYKAESYCRTNPTYYSATIVIDPSKIRNEDHLKRTIIHELLHCVLSRLDTVLDGIKTQIPLEWGAIIENEFDTETERSIVHLEKIIQNCEKEYLNNNA
ncbi:UNVERIFIED_CONTAM: hypothetical protein BEN50_14080 [Euhalothece sp. KZN 001]